MNTLAYVLILAGLLLIRSVYKGRVLQIGEDLSDGFLALVGGDTEKLTEVLGRTGDANKVESPVRMGRTVTPEEIRAHPGLAQACMTLGKAAKGYRFGATGPDYYDCSGLVWRGCQKIGYKGSRFTTATVRGRSDSFKVIPASDVQINDIVLWEGVEGLVGHMGVMTDQTNFYSARSVRSGIGVAKVAGFKSKNPIYLRYVGSNA